MPALPSVINHMEISIAEFDEIRHKQRVADAVKAAEYGTTAGQDSSGPETTEDKPRRKTPRGRYAKRFTTSSCSGKLST